MTTTDVARPDFALVVHKLSAVRPSIYLSARVIGSSFEALVLV